MNKEILFGKDSRDRILKGVQKITDAVRVTMGAAGKCVLIGNAQYHEGFLYHLPTIVSKDGWTVTKHFELSDPVENRGAMMIKEAATKTVEQAGDATTCTCVLAESLITNGMKLIDEGANSQELKKGMDKALEYVLAELKKISVPVKVDLERIRQIASVSANNDKAIGDLIASAYEKIGDDGVINIEASRGTATEIKIGDGFEFDRGWVSNMFITDRAKEICEFENPLILLYDKKISSHVQIDKALALAKTNPLVIICDDAVEQGLVYLAMNNYDKRLRCCVVKAPEFGDARADFMEDIALLTGGIYVSDIRGVNIKDITERHFGKAKKVIITRTSTTIVEGNGNKGGIEDFINDLKMNLVSAKTEEEKYPIEKRIARLTSSVATIQVGAATETELNEKLDRVDDAVRATKAAISEGFVAGGGTAFIRLAKGRELRIDVEELGKIILSPEKIMEAFNQTGNMLWQSKPPLDSFQQGSNILFNALSVPLLQICENAGVNAEIILKSVQNVNGDNCGYNALTGEITDMVEAGIIDSTKALRCALTNAVSVAGMVLTSECSIIAIA